MINIEQSDHSLNISFYNENGEVDFHSITIPDEQRFEWIYSNPKSAFPGVLSWDGKPVRQSKTRYLNKYRITEFLMQQPKEIQDKIFNENFPKKYYCDIETEVIDGLPDHKNPECKILTISVCTEKNLVVVFGLKPLTQDTINQITKDTNEYFAKFNSPIKFKYKQFDSEYTMLYEFFHVFAKQMGFITGWNFIEFDWKYLIARAQLLNIDPTACSPTRKFDRDDLPMHKIIVDYLDVYKKWDRVIYMKESMKLDYVANAALGVKKIKYPGTLNDLYSKDFKLFVQYNAVDSLLVKFIDDKLNTLIPYFKLGYLTRVENNRVFGPVAMVENIMIQQLWKDRRRVFINIRKEQNKDSKYEGAFVLDPKPGMYNYLTTFDYSSLYPTTIRQWNISPDVYIKKDIKHELTDDIIKTATGAIFKRNEDGVLRTLLSDLFAQRKIAKNTAGEIEEEIDYLKKILKEK